MDPSAYTEISEVENRHWWFLARRRIVGSTISALKLPRDSKILEVGAGTGGNLKMLAQFGSVVAAEMDDYARGRAIEQTGGEFDIQYGRCPDKIPFGTTRFDLICMLDVLEHVEEDVETLAELRKRLNPNGVLLITVPAYQWMWSGHDEFLHHKRRYLTSNLREKMLGVGLSVDRITYMNTLLFPLAAASRVADRLVGKKVVSVNKIPASPVNAILQSTFGFEETLLRHFNLPFGVSVMAIGRNKGG